MSPSVSLSARNSFVFLTVRQLSLSLPLSLSLSLSLSACLSLCLSLSFSLSFCHDTQTHRQTGVHTEFTLCHSSHKTPSLAALPLSLSSKSVTSLSLSLSQVSPPPLSFLRGVHPPDQGPLTAESHPPRPDCSEELVSCKEVGWGQAARCTPDTRWPNRHRGRRFEPRAPLHSLSLPNHAPGAQQGGDHSSPS